MAFHAWTLRMFDTPATEFVKMVSCLTPVLDGFSPAPQMEAKPDQLQVNHITYEPHDRVRGRHYPESGGKSRTAYIISQRNEIEGLRAAGAYVDADIMEARSEERRVGKECVRLCRSRWSPYH